MALNQTFVGTVERHGVLAAHQSLSTSWCRVQKRCQTGL